MQSDHLTQDNRWVKLLSRQLQTAEVELVAHFGSARASLGDIVNLRIGDVIPLEAPELLPVEADDVPVLRARLGTRNGHYAVKVDRFVAEEELADFPPIDGPTQAGDSHG